MISFEDYVSDQNFSDVVITTKTNPVDAFVEVPPAYPITKATTLKGIYAFEDMWPSVGDYDMNDVMTKYSFTKYIQNEKVVAEAFTFKTFENYAKLDNGLAVRFDKAIAATDTVRCFLKKEGETDSVEVNFTYEASDNVFLLTNNVKTYMGAEYTIAISHATPIEESEVNEARPFLWRATTDNLRWEMHIAHEKPSSYVDTSFFGTEDDQSIPASGIFYVRSGIYPFAFFLAGADETDVAPLLDPNNESTPISSLYPRYANWVTSNGASDTDWYKK